ncbi:hypothetical protein Kfla_3769 [Kribbella flavida DSM 17836]|uniref:DUF4235 domain-containing protein n=1 Tax=Kribbella flavida (strain DSM 17836 / JCM 10339 / NBRC 14399) TaxID=479435 RepID=D2PP05_KRIFD|nr:DUF4235 domain-containing protein [Kribbella flavida]ADB32823.1 hypothetical protein Kfla_3769 [Kribbella flavida DSM 17836]
MIGAKIGWKLVLAVFTMVVGLVANKAVTTAWKIGAGGKPPKGSQAGYVEVVTWAVASGAAAAAAKRFAEDRAAKYWLKSTGHLPPGYETEAVKDTVKDAVKA